MKDMPIGTAMKKTVTTTKEMGTAHTGAAVLSTPAMIGLMEWTALESMKPWLDDGEQSVGTMVHVWHRKASKIGEPVEIETKLLERDRRKLLFAVKASANGTVLGEGTHERFVIDTKKFAG